MMLIISFILILIASILGANSRIWRAKKNGLFYNTRRAANKIDMEKIHPKLLKYYKNIHFISSPANYVNQAMFAVLVFCIFYLLAPFHWIMIPAACMVAWGQSTLASYWWQIWINRGSGLPDIDPNENHMSEFAWDNISFWFSAGKLFNGKRSIFLPIVGALQILAGFLTIYFLV